MTQFYDARLKPVGLRGTQFAVLAAVGEMGPVPISKLADTLIMDRTTMTRDLRPLEREGLVAIATSGTDRRVRLVQLTHAGRSLLDRATPIWSAIQDEVYTGLGKKNWRGLMKRLDRTKRLIQQA